MCHIHTVTFEIWRFFLAPIIKGKENFSKLGFQAWANIWLVYKFRSDWSTDGWDLLEIIVLCKNVRHSVWVDLLRLVYTEK